MCPSISRLHTPQCVCVSAFNTFLNGYFPNASSELCCAHGLHCHTVLPTLFSSILLSSKLSSKYSCLCCTDGCPTLTNMLVIIVGGIPIAMPTVLNVTLALGAFKLAKEGAIVARMSAVEEMAGMPPCSSMCWMSCFLCTLVSDPVLSVLCSYFCVKQSNTQR